MSTVQTFAATLVAPGRGLAAAADRRSFLPALAAATLVSLLWAAVLVPRLDLRRTVVDALEQRAAESSEPTSPHDREVAVAQAEKLAAFSAYAAALLEPALRALAVATCLFAAFRLAGARPGWGPLLAVSSWGLLPLSARALLSLPALLRADALAPGEAELLLPSSLAAFLPATAPGQLVSAAAAVDLFALWAVALVAVGAAGLVRWPRRRAAAVVLVSWGAYVLLSRVALPGLLAPPPAP
jgi:hypothetical protein